MPISYEIFMKHAAKVLKNETDSMKRYPVIKGVKHYEDGSAVVTDGHRLYIGKNIHGRTDEAVLSHTGEKVEGEYPDAIIRQLLSHQQPQQVVNLSLKDFLYAVERVQTLGALCGDKDATVELRENQIRYESTAVKFRHLIPENFETRTCLRSSYLVDALNLLKAARCEDITLSFFGKNRPITIEHENLIALLLPIRA